MDFQAIRKEYEDQGLDLAHLQQDPLKQLQSWMDLAIESSPGRWFEPNAMTLATADAAQKSDRQNRTTQRNHKHRNHFFYQLRF